MQFSGNSSRAADLPEVSPPVDGYRSGNGGGPTTTTGAGAAAYHAAFVASAVNRQLAALHVQFQNFAAAKDIFAEVVDTGLHAPSLASSGSDIDEYAAIM